MQKMLRSRTTHPRLLAAAVLSFVFAFSASPAHAVSKEIVELQTQVQQLLDMVQRLQSTLDSRFGVVQHLAEQTADDANRMTATVNTLQQKLNTQNDALGSKVDTVSGQVQSLNDSVDELKARITKLDKTVADLQAQLQNAQAPPQAQGQSGASGAAQNASSAQAPPLEGTLQAGVRDYSAGRYQVAQGEFQDVVHYYPMDDAAGTAQYYLGEIAYQQKDYATAISAYNAVLEGFSGNHNAPAAQLHKGLALLATNKKDAGVRELKLLIQRHPQSPEAHTAHSKLNALGVKVTAATTR